MTTSTKEDYIETKDSYIRRALDDLMNLHDYMHDDVDCRINCCDRIGRIKDILNSALKASCSS